MLPNTLDGNTSLTILKDWHKTSSFIFDHTGFDVLKSFQRKKKNYNGIKHVTVNSDFFCQILISFDLPGTTKVLTSVSEFSNILSVIYPVGQLLCR